MSATPRDPDVPLGGFDDAAVQEARPREYRRLPLKLFRQAFVPKLIDISPVVSGRTEVWPGDTRFSTRRVMSQAEGASCNVTTITTTVQIGAHVDAPFHFASGGEDAASLDLRAFLGPARVARVLRRGGITLDDVQAIDLAGVERLLLHARRDGPAPRFRDGFAYLEPDAAEFLAATPLRLLGIDTFSVDHPESKTLQSHHALRAGGCHILEGLELTGVKPGDYELIALPLKLEGCDASPVRAVLRELPPTGARRGGLPQGARRRASSPGSLMDRIPPSPDGDTMQVNCLHSTMHLKKGDKLRVTVDSPANVLLLDDKDFDSYTDGKPYHYYGGWVTKSPVEITAPTDGRWNLVIDVAEEKERGVAAKVEIVK